MDEVTETLMTAELTSEEIENIRASRYGVPGGQREALCLMALRTVDLERELAQAREALDWFLFEATDQDAYVISDKALVAEAVDRFRAARKAAGGEEHHEPQR